MKTELMIQYKIQAKHNKKTQQSISKDLVATWRAKPTILASVLAALEAAMSLLWEENFVGYSLVSN